MSFVRRAEYEHFWQLLAKSRKPLPQKSIEPIRARLVQALESDDRIIVEKVHFTSHDNSLMEVVCTWVGLDANEQDATLADSTHIANIGRLVEEMENQIRHSLNTIYFDKTKSILNSLRSPVDADEKAKREALKGELISALESKAPNRQNNVTNE